MRKSKSDPAKYARNYRKISQRQMTRHDGIDEEKEIERLRAILRDSEAHLKQAQEDIDASEKQTKRKRKQQQWAKPQQQPNDEIEPTQQDTFASILESEGKLLTDEFGDDLIVLPNKKKVKKQQTRAELTPEEIKEAKAVQKKTARKLQQLQTRSTQKKQRAELYKKLELHQISSTALDLLSRSGKISRRDVDTKKQALQKLVKKERAGLDLTKDELDLLYQTRDVDETQMEPEMTPRSLNKNPNTPEKSSIQKKKKKDSRVDDSNAPTVRDDTMDELTEPGAKSTSPDQPRTDHEPSDSSPDEDMLGSKANHEEVSPVPPVAGFDFAAQMMASLSKLKQDSDKKTEKQDSTSKGALYDEVEIAPEKRYVPTEPVQLKTAATLRLESTNYEHKRKVLRIQRPAELEATRYDLPVSGMEFEIMDAIRNNDVTIICGETGSGKSTQVPAMLYEAGMCMNETDPESSFLVGITQPRRVAAVSTAKRVCYEMGCGDGQSIKSAGKRGNAVSYRTRYETAGYGSDTRVMFMTDGILLQEIQTDLLLRRYSVIVLDEAHERNLNTDVLIGLLSVALPLRKKAAEEDPSLVPLKLVLMSATLRVEDFTRNDKLFPTGPPAVVTVPGRTFPVTIHHSKVTELEDYESVAFNKICKIHRRLPQGAILVFLTGKGEIIRMVNKLRKALNTDLKDHQRCTGANDVTEQTNVMDDTGPREMDDDELDAEGAQDDFDTMDDSDDVAPSSNAEENAEDDDIPKKAYVLPLYSLLSTDEQAKVFAPAPEGHRLIVVATNIAETSVTIPGVSYVVDCGRQKCRNFNAGTGVASYDVMWISKAAADQRAGRAGRTGPGHCYRLYSSSLYTRHMDAFALPEVLTRPLEDVVLAMKALNVSNVASFPFPTPPDRSQIDSAVKLLANIGCVDLSKVEQDRGDGTATRLGKAVAKLPLGVRYAKILLVAAQAGVLDYAIVVVSVLSESSPFQHVHEKEEDPTMESDDSDVESMDGIDEVKARELKKQEKTNRKRWHHRKGDILAAMLAVGACTYAGNGAGGASELLATRRFCEENGLSAVIMGRIQKMRRHLASLAKHRLSNAGGVAARTGGFSSKMTPPTGLQERLLVQAIVSGLLDNVALLAPPGSLTGNHPYGLRSAYLSSSVISKEPLYIDSNSAMYSRDFRQLPQWICYDCIVRKTTTDGTPVKIMKNITPVDPSWLGELAKGTKLLSVGGPLASPPPCYDADQDAILCPVSTKFGFHRWEIPPIKQVMYNCLRSPESKQSPDFLIDDSFRWFARFLLEGKILPELKTFEPFLNDSPTTITRRTPIAKVSTLVSSLAEAGVDSASALRKHWAEKDDKFLFKILKSWVKRESQTEAKKLWIQVVKQNVAVWQSRGN